MVWNYGRSCRCATLKIPCRRPFSPCSDSPAVTEMCWSSNNWSTDDTLSRLQEMDDPRLTVLSNVEGVEYPHTISYLFRRATQP